MLQLGGYCGGAIRVTLTWDKVNMMGVEADWFRSGNGHGSQDRNPAMNLRRWMGQVLAESRDLAVQMPWAKPKGAPKAGDNGQKPEASNSGA